MTVSSATTPQRIPRRTVPIAPARDTRPRHLALVDTDGLRRQRRRRWLVRVWAIGIVAAAFIGVGVHALMAQGQLRVDALDEQIQVAQRSVEEAQLQVATAATPRVVVERARALGLADTSAARSIEVDVPTVRRDPARATRPWQAVKPNLESNP